MNNTASLWGFVHSLFVDQAVNGNSLVPNQQTEWLLGEAEPLWEQ